MQSAVLVQHICVCYIAAFLASEVMLCMTGVSPSLHLVEGQMTWLSDAVMRPLDDSMPVCASQGLHSCP